MNRWTADFLHGAAFLAFSAVGLGACSWQARAIEPVNQAASTGGRQEKTMESAKRRVPQVAPVTAGGIRYEVLRGARSRGFQQNGGIIAAVDVATGKELWTLTLYQTRYDPQEEADVQDVFITSLAISKDGKKLLAKSERNKSYEVNLADRSIETLP